MTSLFASARARLVQRWPKLPDPDRFEAALPAARARAFAEAMAAFLAGFVLDDLRALRVPGFAVGIAFAVLILALGSTIHAAALASHYGAALPEEMRRGLVLRRAGWLLAGFLVVALFVAWLVASAGGGDLWPA